MSIVRTKELIENFDLKVVAGENGLQREIHSSEIHRPGIEVTGCFKFHPQDRLQLIGQTEMTYLEQLSITEQKEIFNKLCATTTPCIIISRGMKVPKYMLTIANEKDVPLLATKRKTTRVISRLTNYLEIAFSPSTAIHGVFVEIYGIGVLITGQSGVGKSEVALELIKRGHRLVADDSVEIRQKDGEELIGSSPPLIKNLLEIRGIGIIDIMSLFGAGAVLSEKKISLIIHLELWEDAKQYDRLGMDDEMHKIMDVNIPRSTVPIRPGRNLAIIVEVAAMNFRLKKMGMNAAEAFSDRLSHTIVERTDLVD
ncbi:MAG TPA: HPr(Ser) kinase/phosphatase [Bacillota bacterium]|nr:HPr(Ser) kinase/phosphatase [Bacillota bacterium]